MTLTNESKICRKIFKIFLQKISFEDFKRICADAENIAQEIDIPFKEFIEFLEHILEEMREESFSETGIKIKLDRESS